MWMAKTECSDSRVVAVTTLNLQNAACRGVDLRTEQAFVGSTKALMSLSMLVHTPATQKLNSFIRE